MFRNSYAELSKSSFEEAGAASRLAWKISVVRIVDMAVVCFIDLTMASSNLERDVTGIDCCCRHRKAAEENRSACELMAINFLAFFSQSFQVLNWKRSSSLIR